MNLSFNPYVPILAIGAIGFGFAIFSVAAAALTGPKRYNRAKSDAYECGIEPLHRKQQVAEDFQLNIS